MTVADRQVFAAYQQLYLLRFFYIIRFYRFAQAYGMRDSLEKEAGTDTGLLVEIAPSAQDPTGHKSLWLGGAGNESNTKSYSEPIVQKMEKAGIDQPVFVNTHRDDSQISRIADSNKEKSKDERVQQIVTELVGQKGKGKQLNVVGYSMGSVDGSNAVVKFVEGGGKVDNLVLIATPIRDGNYAGYSVGLGIRAGGSAYGGSLGVSYGSDGWNFSAGSYVDHDLVFGDRSPELAQATPVCVTTSGSGCVQSDATFGSTYDDGSGIPWYVKGAAIVAGTATVAYAGYNFFKGRGFWAPNMYQSVISGYRAMVSRSLGFTTSQFIKFQGQLGRDGMRSLMSSRQTISAKLAKHIGDLERYRAAGGYTSSVEREIRNFRQELQAIDEVLRLQK